MPTFALTGSLSSGKTLTLKLLRLKGAVIFDCDKVIRRYYRSGEKTVYRQIALAFPEALKGKGICRKKLGAIVFSDAKKLRKLEKIIHPVVIKELKNWVKKNRGKRGVYIAEVPLLFEKKLEGYFYGVILVYAKKNVLIERIRRKFHLSRNKALCRLSLFMPMREKIKRSDFVIDNSFNLKRLKGEVNLLWNKF